MIDKLKKFLILFSRLKNETNNSPDNLKWLPGEKPSLTGLCFDLWSCYNEILKFMSNKETKDIIAPPAFSYYWDVFREEWLAAVKEASNPEGERIKSELITLLQQLEDKAVKLGKTREEFHEDIMKILPKFEQEFNPLVDNPADVMNDLGG